MFWQDQPDLLAGRDLVAGGTWLGVSTGGRFAAVTNFAEQPPEPQSPRSRGELTANFLSSDMDCLAYMESVQKKAESYRGFNLLLSDGKTVFYFNNRENRIQQLKKGYYGLSNQRLDCNWPKVISGRHLMKQHLLNNLHKGADALLMQELFELLASRGDNTPHSARFILGETYGTSVSTVVEVGEDGIDFEERGFAPSGQSTGALSFHLPITANDG